MTSKKEYNRSHLQISASKTEEIFIPQEILEMVFSHLNLLQLTFTCAGVCQRWRAIIRSMPVFRPCFLNQDQLPPSSRCRPFHVHVQPLALSVILEFWGRVAGKTMEYIGGLEYDAKMATDTALHQKHRNYDTKPLEDLLIREYQRFKPVAKQLRFFSSHDIKEIVHPRHFPWLKGLAGRDFAFASFFAGELPESSENKSLLIALVICCTVFRDTSHIIWKLHAHAFWRRHHGFGNVHRVSTSPVGKITLDIADHWNIMSNATTTEPSPSYPTSLHGKFEVWGRCQIELLLTFEEHGGQLEVIRPLIAWRNGYEEVLPFERMEDIRRFHRNCHV